MKISGFKHFEAGRTIRTNLEALCVLKYVLPSAALGAKGKGQAGDEALVIALPVHKGVPAECYSF